MQDRKNSRESRRIEDLKLIERIRLGDQDCLERLVDRYIPQLAGFFAYLRAPEMHIDDLVQETFEKVLRNLDKYDDSKPFFSWLLTIGRNHYFDQCRREKRKSEFQQSAIPEIFMSPEDEIVDRETAAELLRELSDGDRFLLELRVFQQMPFAEIAELTGEVEGTLRSRFFRLLGRLRISGRARELKQAEANF